MNICPQCGTLNRPEAHFCRQCQSVLLPATTSACSYCGAALRADAHFCKQCGQPVTAAPDEIDTRSFCPRCGAAVRSNARFCARCRTPLAASYEWVTGPPCPTCGTPTRPGARFCRICSHPLQPAPLPSGSDQPLRQTGRFGTGSLLPLTVLAGRYAIMEKIAQGGMGAIYRAQDRRLQDRIVAVKEMSEKAIMPSERKRVLESFQREAELLARLEHPNLVRVTDRFQEGERQYMVMEFIAGQTLEKMLEGRTQPFPEAQVLAWSGQLCDVLSYLHSQDPRIIYRDVKPANVMAVSGTDVVKLIDFGIARFFKPGQGKDTIEFGTDGYAPPEQYGKSQTDERADIYALGAMLHRLLTLRDPATRLFYFPPVRSLNPQVSPGVEAAVARAVENNKNERHQSMEEMKIALLGKSAQPARAPTLPPSGPGQSLPISATIDFGAVLIGSDVPARSLSVAIPAGEQATLSTDVRWLYVHPRDVGDTSNQAIVTLDTRRFKPGRLALSGAWLKTWAGWHTRFLVPLAQEQRGHVEMQLKTGPHQYTLVSATAVPRRWQVYAGWMGTGLAMLIEAAIVLALVVALVGS